MVDENGHVYTDNKRLNCYGHQDERIINYLRKEVIKKLQADIMTKQNFTFVTTILPIPVAARSKTARLLELRV